MTNITVLDSTGATQNLSTGSGSGSAGSPFTSPAAVSLGGVADAAVTNPASSASVIAALKGILTAVNLIPAAPATAGAQTTGNNSLATIATNTGQPVAQRIITATAITRPADTNVYALGDLLANNVTAGSVVFQTGSIASANDVVTSVIRMRLKKSGTTVTNATFRIHLYNAAPTPANGDNGAWSTNQSGYQGSFDVTIDKAFTDGAEGIGIPQIGPNVAVQPVSGAQTIYYVIEVRAAYTPASAEVFTPIFEVQ